MSQANKSMLDHLNFIAKFADTVAETFKQFAHIIKQEHSRQEVLSHQLKKRQPSQPLKLVQQQGHAASYNPNLTNGRPSVNYGNGTQHQIVRQNMYTGDSSQMNQQRPQVAQRPQNPFTLYIQENRVPILKANPHMDFQVVTRDLTEKWKQMTPQMKRPFIERYEQMKKRDQQQQPAQNSNVVLAQSHQPTQQNTHSVGHEISLQTTIKNPVPANILVQSKEIQIPRRMPEPVVKEPQEEEEDDVFDDMIPEAEKKRKAELKMEKLRQKEDERTKQIERETSKPIQLQEAFSRHPEESKIAQYTEVAKPVKKIGQIDNVEDLLNNDLIEEEKYSAKKIRQTMLSQAQGQENSQNQNDQIFGTGKFAGKVETSKEQANSGFDTAENENYFGQHPHIKMTQSEGSYLTPDFQEAPFELIKEEHHDENSKGEILQEALQAVRHGMPGRVYEEELSQVHQG